MLEIVAVALGESSVHCTLHPGNIVDLSITPALHELKSEGVARVDDPNENEAVLLQLGDWNLFNGLVG